MGSFEGTPERASNYGSAEEEAYFKSRAVNEVGRTWTGDPENDARSLLASLDAAVRDRLDMTGLLRRLLAADAVHIGTFATDGQWGELDNPQDAELYESMLAKGELVLESAAPLRQAGPG